MPAAEARVSALDRGLTHGLGLYETLKLVGGVPVFFDEHAERLAASRLELEIPEPCSRDELALGIVQLAAASGVTDGACRLLLSAGPPWGEPTLLIQADVRAFPSGPLKVIARRSIRSSGEFKSISFIASYRAQQAAARAHADDAIFVDTDDRIHEAATANVFIAHGGALTTSPLDGAILPGVIRSKVMQLARADGIEVAERHTLLTELGPGHAMFLTSSVRGIVPVAKVDDIGLGFDEPLLERLRRLVGEAERAAAAAFRARYVT